MQLVVCSHDILCRHFWKFVELQDRTQLKLDLGNVIYNQRHFLRYYLKYRLNFRAEQEFPAIWLLERFLNRTQCKPLQAVYVTFFRPVTKRASFAISASSHGGRLVNDFFVYSEDIILRQDVWRDGEFSTWLLSSLDQKSFQAELVLTMCEAFKWIELLMVKSQKDGLQIPVKTFLGNWFWVTWELFKAR